MYYAPGYVFLTLVASSMLVMCYMTAIGIERVPMWLETGLFGMFSIFYVIIIYLEYLLFDLEVNN